MTLLTRVFVVVMAALVLTAGIGGEPAASVEVTETEELVIRTCEGAVRLFRNHADDIWPGYDLSERPVLVYVPGQVAVLLNCSAGAEGFEPCPDEWPELAAETCCRTGQLGNLVGQLAFGYDAGGVTTVAIGFPDPLPSLDRLEAKMLGYVVHEAFHQYQDETFGEIAWAREQEYPIDDAENSALAYLEMLLLMDAVETAWSGDIAGSRLSAAQFVAVRAHRWQRASEFIEAYESGKETREGTARYVELRALALFGELVEASRVPGDVDTAGAFAAAAMPGALLDGFRDRMTDGFVPSADLPRNRIYPVASAQGFLLDSYGVDWKPEAERATPGFTYARLLADDLGLEEGDQARLLEIARTEHDYPALLAAAEREVERHMYEYRELLAAFEGQEGRRIEIKFDSNGLYRSRSTSATKMVADRGVHELCERYDVYTLERDGTFFELHDTGLLEENDHEGYTKTVVFYTPSVETVNVGGDAMPAPSSPASAPDQSDAEARGFTTLRMVGDGFELTHQGTGAI